MGGNGINAGGTRRVRYDITERMHEMSAVIDSAFVEFLVFIAITCVGITLSGCDE